MKEPAEPVAVPLTPELAAAQFTTQRKKERQVTLLAARGVRSFSFGVALSCLAGLGAIAAPPAWFALAVVPAAAVGGLLVLFGAFCLFGALSLSRR